MQLTLRTLHGSRTVRPTNVERRAALTLGDSRSCIVECGSDNQTRRVCLFGVLQNTRAKASHVLRFRAKTWTLLLQKRANLKPTYRCIARLPPRCVLQARNVR